MEPRSTHLDAIRTSALLQQRLAKCLVLQCFRNSRLEDLHAGIAPSSATGDYVDVTVTSPFGVIPWPRVSRFNDEEMKQLMIEVVDQTYRFIHMLFDEHTGPLLIQGLTMADPLPRWSSPSLEPRQPDSPR
jgi:ligand-binding SRPBCC domain-containing protein